MVKSLSSMQETYKMKVQSLGREDQLEEGIVTHPNILAWRIPWTEEPGRLRSIVMQRVSYNSSGLAHTHHTCKLEIGHHYLQDVAQACWPKDTSLNKILI